MAQRLRKLLLRDDPTPNELLTAIREVRQRLENVNARFDMESEGDLIESCIYEMESLRARYRYLLRQAKQQGVAAGQPLTDDSVAPAAVPASLPVVQPSEGETTV